MSNNPKIPGFEIVKALGKGGVATVYLGNDLKLKRKVAIKILFPDLKHPNIQARFEKEATIAANFYHSNIISIFDVGYLIDGQDTIHYIVMEYLEETLKNRLKDSPGFRLPPGTALQIIDSIMKALDYAHKEKVIHRDIKPENIMFRRDGTPVLVDFGIARVMDIISELTRSGMMPGTPEYMSPEQCKAKKDLDGRTDVYSLGVVLFETLTGKRPYSGDNPIKIALQHIDEPIPRLPEELKLYQPIIDRMMAKNRDERITSYDEFIQLQKNLLETNEDIRKEENINKINNFNPLPPAPTVAGPNIPDAPEESINSDTVLFFQPPRPATQPVIIPPKPPQPTRKKNIKTMVEIVLLSLILMVLLYILFFQPPATIDEPLDVPMISNQPITGQHGTQTGTTKENEQYIPGILEMTESQVKIEPLTEPAPPEPAEKKPVKQPLNKKEIPQPATPEPKPLPKKEPQEPITPSLRHTFKNPSTNEVESFIKKRDIYEARFNPGGNFVNKLEKHTTGQDVVIVDKATGLMWYNGKPAKALSYANAQKWLKEFNKEKYWGFSDWRLPTVEEAATLLEQQKNKSGLHMNDVFYKLNSIWTGDRLDSQACWVVLFSNGWIYPPSDKSKHHVMPVRWRKP